MGQRTYRSVEKWRASEVDNGGCLVHTETVHSNGRIEWSVKGTSDGEYVNKSGVRQASSLVSRTPSGELDFVKIDAARVRSGWTIEAVS